MRTSHGAQQTGRKPRRARLVALMIAVVLGGGGVVAGTPQAATAEGPTRLARTTADPGGAGPTSGITTLARPRWTAGAVPLG